MVEQILKQITHDTFPNMLTMEDLFAAQSIPDEAGAEAMTELLGISSVKMMQKTKMPWTLMTDGDD